MVKVNSYYYIVSIRLIEKRIRNINLFNPQYCSEHLKEYTLLLKTNCGQSNTNLIISTAKIINCS